MALKLVKRSKVDTGTRPFASTCMLSLVFTHQITYQMGLVSNECVVLHVGQEENGNYFGCVK